MRSLKSQRGSLLLIAVALIVVVSAMAVAISRLIVSDATSGAHHSNSAQALFVADSGIERALFGFRTGTACNALAFNNVAVGNGTFTTTGTLFQPASTNTTAAINATVVVIPVTNTAFYAPHGRITIDAEQMDYTGVTATSFTGVRRGVNGTTAAAHANNRPVVQNQCLVRSTGTVGTSRRAVEAGVVPAVGATRSDFLAGGSVNIGTAVAGTLIGSLASPAFPTNSTNIIIAAVALQNLTTTAYDPPPPPINNPAIPGLNANQLRLVRQGAAGNIAANAYAITVGSKQGSAAPSAQSFTREMMFLVGRQIAVPASPTYQVLGRATTNNAITGEVKMVVINNPPSSARAVGSVANVASGGNGSNILNNTAFGTGAAPIPAGNRAIIAAVQLFNSNNSDALPIDQLRTIPAGGLRLRRGNQGGPILVQNELPIDLSSQLGTAGAAGNVYNANRSTSILLVVLDPAGGNNQRYTLQVQLSPFGGGNSGVSANGQVAVMGLNANMTAAVIDGPAVAVGAADTVLANLATTLGAGEQVVIAGAQYQNAGGGIRSIAANNERLVVSGVTQSQSQYGLNLCNTATSIVCDDFGSGLLWRTANGPANPTYEVHAQADAAGINAEAKILAIRMVTGVVPIDWLEVVL